MKSAKHGEFMLEGYKIFNKDLTNRYGKKFEIGNIYSIEGDISFGNYGNGFHMCKNLCDAFRYYDSEECCVAKVEGYGDYIVYDDEYYGYYDMYSVRSIKLIELLSREDIIDMMLNDNNYNIVKFIKTFKMNKYETKLFLDKYNNSYDIIRNLFYYQIERNYKDEEIAKIKKIYKKYC